VVTISRVGLTLASGVYIKKLTSEQQVETSPMPSTVSILMKRSRNGHLKRNLRRIIEDDVERAITENEERYSSGTPGNKAQNRMSSPHCQA
jgi:altronate dehydratase